jgi:outer membrane receptor protein involved in Fe transport
MKLFRLAAVVSLLLLVSAGAFAQGMLTGALTGTVTTDGAPLPGATVTVSSPSLQGTRTSITDGNGNYNFVGLPPGEYTVRMELEGLQTITRTARVTLSGTARVDAAMTVAAMTEAITVTASAPAVIETTEVQSNFQKQQVDSLPIGRGVQAIANLAPGVVNNGPSNAMMISGAMSYDNLVLVDGATVQENLRGQTRPLYVEDAIQETTVITGAVSAEFGRFTGGVITSVTKSGGNEFSGSVRDTMTDPSWTEPSAAGEAKAESKLGNTYEATLGGRIIRDRLWFFAAGRFLETQNLSRFPNLIGQSEQIFSDTTNNRLQGKLTGQIFPRHSIMATYLDNPLETTNDIQPIPAWEMSAFDPSFGQKEDFLSVNYNGIFTNNLLGEVNWSRRNFAFDSLGGDSQDVYAGTPLRTSITGASGLANAPWFCGSCDTETRDMELLTGKLTYFLGSRSFGTHNVVGGFDHFTELRTANNWQSGSGLTVWLYHVIPTRRADGRVIFTFDRGDSVESFLVENPSLGSDLTTDSFFVNDKWDLNNHWSFNLGLRYDLTDAVDQAGNPTADESSFSPRLGVTFDPTGNGRLRLGATYGKYVGRLAEAVQGAGSNAGSPNWYGWYTDDDPNFTPFTGTAEEVVRYAIDWWLARGGNDLTRNPPTDVSIGGVSTQLEGSLLAPDTTEYTIGAGWQYSTNGYLRADYIDRDWDNFYTARTDMGTGRVTLPSGAVTDLTLVTNSNLLDRKYKAVQLQANQRVLNRLNLGASYTWSELTGNTEGENVGSGPITTGGWVFQYPEYQGFAQNAPMGFLGGDQTHKLRAWAGIDVPLGPAGVMNFSVLQRFDSGTPYSAVALLNRPAVTNPGYVAPPQAVTYYFSDRGEFRWDDVTRTDLAVNYRLPIMGRAELFVEGEVFNMFNEQAQISGSTTILTGRNSQTACGTEAAPVRCANFNPFTETPVEGVHWAKLTPESAARLRLAPSTIFGNATNSTHYQLARTYQVSLGLRF